MSDRNLNSYCGSSVEDDGDLTNLHDVIDELEGFVEQFSTHAMSDEALVLRGNLEAYQDVIDYLSRVAPVKKESEE